MLCTYLFYILCFLTTHLSQIRYPFCLLILFSIRNRRTIYSILFCLVNIFISTNGPCMFMLSRIRRYLLQQHPFYTTETSFARSAYSRKKIYTSVHFKCKRYLPPALGKEWWLQNKEYLKMKMTKCKQAKNNEKQISKPNRSNILMTHLNRNAISQFIINLPYTAILQYVACKIKLC